MSTPFASESNPSRQLTSPEVNYSIVRPLTNRFSKDKNHAIIYVLMVNRSVSLDLPSAE